MLWVVPRERSFVVGAIGLAACEFFKCRFVNVGIAMKKDEASQFRRAVGSGG
ncbi:hypothetical protein BH23ACT10_BH23ACT10_13920 [soil metagenome]